jgi:RHH-type rel operon transcriptional repressor/antitoxin RelB
MLAIRLPEDIERRLYELATATGRTKTFYAREAIVEYLDDLEDAYLAGKRMEDLKRGKDKKLSPEEFWKSLDR